MGRQLDFVDAALLWGAGAIGLFLVMLGLVWVALRLLEIDGGQGRRS